ncbi:MAG: SDR family NAD(P)-dependent oxidoreductase, partial [Phycisphaerae bacterium]|nr:SDR family NAD(P)-dependent oxidoreductase [Phycisphaerae bacterium]
MRSQSELRPVVLITGASTGIGRGAAFWMAARGWRSLAGVRTERDAASIASDAQRDGLAVEPVLIDVTDAGSIASCVQDVRRRLGGAPLAGLVNNAGVAVAGPVEHVPLDAWRRQFEVNLFGQVAVTQAFLPMLREAVALLGRGRARVVLMSSIAGRVGQPILGPYCASKHALEAVGDAL